MISVVYVGRVLSGGVAGQGAAGSGVVSAHRRFAPPAYFGRRLAVRSQAPVRRAAPDRIRGQRALSRRPGPDRANDQAGIRRQDVSGMARPARLLGRRGRGPNCPATRRGAWNGAVPRHRISSARRRQVVGAGRRCRITRAIYRFYQDYHRHLRLQGVDGVKVDSQGTLESVSHGSGGARVHDAPLSRRAGRLGSHAVSAAQAMAGSMATR